MKVVFKFSCFLFQLRRNNHRSLLDQSTYLVTHYYFIRLPVSLILITICILTPFTVTWSPAVDIRGSFENTSVFTNDLIFGNSNLSFTQNYINQVRNIEKYPIQKCVGDTNSKLCKSHQLLSSSFQRKKYTYI